MHALDDVTAVVEDTADVLSVHGAGKVRVAIVAPISTSSADSLPTHQKLIPNEVLGPGHAWVLSGLGSRYKKKLLIIGVASELWKVVLNLRFASEDFLSKQVLLVEEENHRDGAHPHAPVVPDALEEVQSLLQAVSLVVLPNDHVVAAAGHHEDDGSHIIEALDPLAALIAWDGTTIHLLEVDFVHLELGLKDSRGQDTAAHAYLVTWHVVGLLDHINLVQEAWKKRRHVNQLVLIGALVAGTHSLILPQSLGMWEVKVRHVHHAQNVVHSELVLRVGQLHRGHQVAHGGHNDTYFNGLLQVVFDVLHFSGLLTTVGLKGKKKENHIASCPPGCYRH
uniref:Predicted gene, 20721 n=1 Tax=Mus spicilegus TaxID=10103 RepID=A0A8C6I9Q6_MUSSI